MKTSALFVAVVTSLLLIGWSGIAAAGTGGGVPGAVPEPTALLVWLGLTAAGALFFWRRNRGEQ